MKSIGRSVLHHDPKLAVMVEENLANRAENSDDGVDQEDDIEERSLAESPLQNQKRRHSRESQQRRHQRYLSHVSHQEAPSRRDTHLPPRTQRQQTSRYSRPQESSDVEVHQEDDIEESH